MEQLKGKVAIVTGASKGIGAAIAKGLGRAGAKVVINYASSRADAEKVASEVPGAVLCQGSVADPADAARIVQAAIDAFGRLDILVNNAGVYSFGPLEGVTVEEVRRQYDVNVLGPILMVQRALAFMADGGSVVNIGSMASRMTNAGSLVYAGTKGALDAMTEVLAKELGPRGIRVNSINPGATQTEGAFAIGVFETAYAEDLRRRTPLGRFAVPEDIAPLAVFLASDEARWITGQLIAASGGLA